MKNRQGISAYYYPTLAILVDDSQRLLTTISYHLDANLAYISFTNPKLALRYIQKTNATDYLSIQCIAENEQAETFGLTQTEHDIKIDLSNIYKQIHNPERFNEPSVIVLDYSMPGMNGLEFCETLKKTHPAIKIILLTGEADESKGIEMFNRGLIDRFMLKGDYFGETVNTAIIELQKNYFEEQSQTLLENLSTKSILCLKDDNFIKIFQEICQKHSIVEYYLIENTGSFLLLTRETQPLWLIVASDAELKDYYDMAQDSKMPKGLLKLLKEGKKIPYFNDQRDYMNVSGMAWEAYLHPAHKIQSRQKEMSYYYALIKDPDVFRMETDKVLSYKNYLENVWPPI